jgi:ERCC4-related helicase
VQDLLPGTQVEARGLRWEVVFSHPAGEQQLFRLRCLDGALRGNEVDLLSPFEKVNPLGTVLDPERAAPLPHFRLYLQAFLLEQALGPNALLAAQPGRLEIQPYQLVPVMRALRMSRPRLLLADGVGLGKTIQAGLVLAELIARRRAHRVLIVSPAGPLLNQWRLEMGERFGLRFDVLDSERLHDIQFQNELGANPFDHAALGLISIDFAKQERILQFLERTSYDVVIIDEAHHCMSLGASGDRDDSQRRRLAEVLAQRADALLLLSATPHDGYDPHFASIIELLDPSLVDGRGSLRGDAFRRHTVRRLKRHIKDAKTGQLLFKKRQVHPERVSFNQKTHPAFAAFQEALLALVAPHLRRALRQRRYGEVLAFVALLKRSVSTATACRNTLETISNRLAHLTEKGSEAQEERKQRLRTLRDYRRRLDRFGVLSFEEEQDQANLEAEDVAAEILDAGADELLEKLQGLERETRRERQKLGKVSKTHAALDTLIELAKDAITEDPKLASVEKAIAAIRKKEPKANVLVYTEYADSQAVVVRRLADAVRGGTLTGQILELSGESDDEARITVTSQFRTQDDLVLVSTDASAEGLNLHDRCHHLVHLELPYNPNRLEQRNGRIDRYGQKHDPEVRYLYLGGTFEERLLLRLIAKYEKQRERLTFVPNTLGLMSSEAGATVRLLEGIAQEDAQLFKQLEKPMLFDADEHADIDTPAYRELLSEVERAFSSFDKAAKTHDWLDKAGLAAEEVLVGEAEVAREAAHRFGITDLAQFVIDAARADLRPGDVKALDDKTWELRLSGPWLYNLEETLGFDPSTKALLVSEDMDYDKTADGRAVGYLGRAHPVVRRALDRVRNIQFGNDGHQLDRRVSAARSDTKEAELLVLYLGRVQSGVGREFERVVAVRVSKSGPPFSVEDSSDWIRLTDPNRAVPTAGLWKKHFAAWGDKRLEAATKTANDAFGPMAEQFIATHRDTLAREAQDLDSWLRARTEELCGEPGLAQVDLFGKEAPTPPWKSLKEPLERLASFGSDGSNPPKARSEAQTVVKLFTARKQDLARRQALEVTEPEPLGILMLVPGDRAEGRPSWA